MAHRVVVYVYVCVRHIWLIDGPERKYLLIVTGTSPSIRTDPSVSSLCGPDSIGERIEQIGDTDSTGEQGRDS